MAKEIKRRNGCVTAWLWVAIILNLLMTIFYAVSMFEAYSSEMALGFGLCSILGLLNILGAIMLMRWNKTGFYLFLFSTLLMAVVNVAVLKIEPVSALGSLFAIFIWWAILQAKKDGVSAWSQLVSGWDYKHTRHLYQLFVIAGIILFVLTLFAVGKDHEDPYEGIIDDDAWEEIVIEEELAPEEIDSIAVEEEEPIVPEETVNPTPAPAPAPAPAPTPAADKSLTRSSTEPSFSGMSQQEIDNKLKDAMAGVCSELPVDTGMGLIMTRIYLSGDYIMFVYECDEEIIPMEELEGSQGEMVNSIKNTVSSADAEMKAFLRICAQANKGIGFTFVGDTSGVRFTGRISSSELKRLVK